MEINRDLIREAMKEGYSFYQMNGKLVIRRAGGFKKGDLKTIPNTVKLPRMPGIRKMFPHGKTFADGSGK